MDTQGFIGTFLGRHPQDVLERLLSDKTTKRNIIWADDEYADLGDGYDRYDEITVERITGGHADLIMPRTEKDRESQAARTRTHAEVFTPSWLCCRMNDDIDEQWFGQPRMFAVMDGHHWAANPFPIAFGDADWSDYVDCPKLEVTCGEAPFICSRYDTVSGEPIPVESRIGFLDRKLRVVGENTADREEWTQAAFRALESTYGYEYQGDNLLVARINVLETFAEHMHARWDCEPTVAEVRRAANIIAWNLWQMDGLTDTPPSPVATREPEPMDLFDSIDEPIEEKAKPCLIYHWRGHRSVAYASLKRQPSEGVGMRKFYAVIGNPPYQIDQNGRMLPIYDRFMDESYLTGQKVELITPGRFLFNAGQTSRTWNEKMLSDKHLKVLDYSSNSKDYFTGVDIKGGVAITLHDATQEFDPIETFIEFDELRSAVDKMKKYNTPPRSIDVIVFTSDKYNLSAIYKEHPEYRQFVKSDGKHSQIDSIAFAKMPIFLEEKPQDSSEYINFFGRLNNRRVYRWVQRKYIMDSGNINGWKVLVPSSNGSGAFGESLSSPLTSGPNIGYTQSFLGIGNFPDQTQANNLLSYLKTKFCRAMLGTLKITQHNPPSTWHNVPLQDFTADSDIDWSQSIADIDRQLYRKYGLDADEIDFIESHVKEMH